MTGQIFAAHTYTHHTHILSLSLSLSLAGLYGEASGGGIDALHHRHAEVVKELFQVCLVSCRECVYGRVTRNRQVQVPNLIGSWRSYSSHAIILMKARAQVSSPQRLLLPLHRHSTAKDTWIVLWIEAQIFGPFQRLVPYPAMWRFSGQRGLPGNVHKLQHLRRRLATYLRT